jgi:hypothetical protein
VEENLLDDTPMGFSNNMRWNIGHSSAPSLWIETPPSMIELRNNSLKQQDDIIDSARGRLE